MLSQGVGITIVVTWTNARARAKADFNLVGSRNRFRKLLGLSL